MQNNKTANQFIKPVTYKINDSEHIEIGGCDVVDLAERYGTPLYVCDEKTIRTIAQEYKDAFKSYPKVEMMFASKAFMTKSIVRILDEEGFGFDMVSGGEIYTAKTAGADMSRCLFNGSNKSYDELQMAVECGVGLISVDNFFELSLLNNVAKSNNRTVDILLRVTPGIECHTHEYIQTGHLDSKFGFDLTQIDEAIELIQDEYVNLNLVGLHAHIGSQIFETSIYYDEVAVLLKEMGRIQDKFGIKTSIGNISNLKNMAGVKSGTVGGQFQKGQVSWNKGKKWSEFMSEEGQKKSLKTCFKKGNVPANRKEIGYERVDHEGFVYVKVQDLHQNRNFKQKHYLVWEQHNGPVPKGYILRFLDGNRQNCDISNLALVSVSEKLILSKMQRTTNPELHKTQILVAKVMDKARKRKRKDKTQDKDYNLISKTCALFDISTKELEVYGEV